MQSNRKQHAGSPIAFVLSLVMALGPLSVLAESPNKPPSITHTPVTHGIRGQSLTLKAKVTDTAPGVQDVTLYYALFRDAAPFRVPMKTTGLDLYIGTIDAGMIKDVDTIAYYIEAQDKDGALAETPWYNVEFKKPDPNAPAVVTPDGNAKPPESSGSGWRTAGYIAGGAAAIALGAVALGGGGGGGGGDGGSDTNSATYAGTYNGTATICLTVSGQSPSCESHACTIVVDNKGKVFSETLLPGQQLTGNLSGNDFFLSGKVQNQGTVTNGTVNFSGAIVNNSIAGSVTGNAETSGGPGSYSGSFSASKNP